jgi:hypothetical protein
LKTVCRGNGILHWPFRKLKSIERKIEEIKSSFSLGTTSPQLTDELEDLQQQKNAIYRRPIQTPQDIITQIQSDFIVDTLPFTNTTPPSSPSELQSTTITLCDSSPSLSSDTDTMSDEAPSPQQQRDCYVDYSVQLFIKRSEESIQETMFESSIVKGLLPFYNSSQLRLSRPIVPLQHQFLPRMFFSEEEVMPPLPIRREVPLLPSSEQITRTLSVNNSMSQHPENLKRKLEEISFCDSKKKKGEVVKSQQ